MKKIIALLSFCSLTAQADLNYQMSNVTGIWHFANNPYVILVQKQTDNQIKVYRCDRTTYLTQNGYCEYSKISLYSYNSFYDGFCIISDKSCETGLQVSLQYGNQLIETIDPLSTYDFSNTGRTAEARKLK